LSDFLPEKRCPPIFFFSPHFSFRSCLFAFWVSVYFSSGCRWLSFIPLPSSLFFSSLMHYLSHKRPIQNRAYGPGHILSAIFMVLAFHLLFPPSCCCGFPSALGPRAHSTPLFYPPPLPLPIFSPSPSFVLPAANPSAAGTPLFSVFADVLQVRFFSHCLPCDFIETSSHPPQLGAVDCPVVPLTHPLSLPSFLLRIVFMESSRIALPP